MNGALTSTSVQARATFRPTAARAAAPRSSCLRVHALAQVPSVTSLCSWQQSRHPSCVCTNTALRSTLFHARLLPLRPSICRLMLQDQRSPAQAGASALIASATALILALPGLCHVRHAFRAVSWDTAGRSYCLNRCYRRVLRLLRNYIICMMTCRSFRCSNASLHTCGRHWH